MPAELQQLGNDFLPILDEVLGKVSGVVAEGAAAAPTLDVLGPAQPPAAAAASSSGDAAAEGDQRRTAAAAGAAGFAAAFRGRPGLASFRTPLEETLQPASAAAGGGGSSAAGGQASFRSGPGSVSFSRGPGTGAGGAAAAAAGGAPGGLAGPAKPAAPPPEIRLSRQQLVDVSRAILGRLDVVDLIGRNTALEAAERVRAPSLMRALGGFAPRSGRACEAWSWCFRRERVRGEVGTSVVPEPTCQACVAFGALSRASGDAFVCVGCFARVGRRGLGWARSPANLRTLGGGWRLRRCGTRCWTGSRCSVCRPCAAGWSSPTRPSRPARWPRTCRCRSEERCARPATPHLGPPRAAHSALRPHAARCRRGRCSRAWRAVPADCCAAVVVRR